MSRPTKPGSGDEEETLGGSWRAGGVWFSGGVIRRWPNDRILPLTERTPDMTVSETFRRVISLSVRRRFGVGEDFRRPGRAFARGGSALSLWASGSRGASGSDRRLSLRRRTGSIVGESIWFMLRRDPILLQRNLLGPGLWWLGYEKFLGAEMRVALYPPYLRSLC